MKKLATALAALALLGATAVPASAAPGDGPAEPYGNPCKAAPKSKLCAYVLADEGEKWLATSYRLPGGPGVKVRYWGVSKVRRMDNHVFLLPSKVLPGAVHKYRTYVDMEAAMTGRRAK